MNKIIENLVLGLIAIAFLATIAIMAPAQNVWSAPIPNPQATVSPARPAFPTTSTRREPPAPQAYLAGDASERSIKVDSGVNLTLCVTQGTVKVNGWNRNEVRVYIEDGSKFGFKVLQKNPKTSDPVWIMLAGIEPKMGKFSAHGECIWGGEIEIDLPTGATVNIKGQETTTTIDSVKKATVRTIGGDISLRNIAGGIAASAGQGDITVEESWGGMVLESTTGNIVVFKAGPSEIGDIFKAKTNSGAISLQKLDHRQIDVGSISGTLIFNGEILSGGSYSLSTSNGSIRLSIPQSSSCLITASYGFGKFISELPIKIMTENITDGPVKSIIGTVGKGGDATLKLTTNNGSISIKKQ